MESWSPASRPSSSPLTQKLPVRFISEKWLLECRGFNRLGSRIYNRIKRLSDVLVASIVLLLFLPLGLVIAAVIGLTSRGPVLFRQERVGRNSRPFKLIKFRTMKRESGDGPPRWTRPNDPRITAVGSFLRRTRLDEVPQLWNVLRGQMSLIGPRPEQPYFVEQIKPRIPYYSLRFTVKPGITGWAQVHCRYGASFQDALEKLQYELYYVKNMSLFLDAQIILKTVRTVLLGMGR